MSTKTPHIPETRGRKNAPYIEELIAAIIQGESSYTVSKANVNSARVCISRNRKVREVLNINNKWITTRILNGKLVVYIEDRRG